MVATKLPKEAGPRGGFGLNKLLAGDIGHVFLSSTPSVTQTQV